MITRTALIAVAALVAGCASAPTTGEIAGFDYGPYPSAYQTVIQDYLRQRLKDPDSAQYQWERGPSQGWDRYGRLNVGWRVCLQVNAKNSFGGYTGFRPYYFIINRDRIVRVEAGDNDVSRSMVQGACASV